MAKDCNISDILEKIAAATEAIAEGHATGDSLDRYYAALLDDTNTTKVFKSWIRAARNADSSATNYELLTRFAAMLAMDNDHTYTVRFYDAAESGETRGTPLDDLADKAAQVFATDSGVIDDSNYWIDGEGAARTDGEDWATEDRMTWYVRANAISLADGTMDITAIEGVDDEFDITGDTAPVYTFYLSKYFKQEYKDGYEYNSWKANPYYGYHPFNENINTDGTRRYLGWQSTFDGTKNTDGYLTSGAGNHPSAFTTAANGLTLARKWDAYEGVGAAALQKYLLFEFRLRHFNKENGNILEGCTAYNYQHTALVAETGVKRVLLSTTNAAHFIVGSTVEITDSGSSSTPDRGISETYSLITGRYAQVLSVEEVTVDGETYGAVNVDCSDTFDTTTTTWISTMPWDTGTTEGIIGNHLDGSIGSLTSGRYPLRVAGIEAMIGAYAVGLDILWNCTANETSGYDYVTYIQRDSELQASAVTNYTETGLTYEGKASGWQYIMDFQQTELPVCMIDTLGGGSTTYVKSAFYGASSAGVRCPWVFALLSSGGNAGLAATNGNTAPSNSNWNGVPRLAGAEKKRGEYSA